MRMQFLLFLCRPYNLQILQHKEDNYSDNHTVILTNLNFRALQFSQLIAVRIIRFLHDNRDSRLFLVRFMSFLNSYFYAHEFLFRKLQFTRLSAVRFMRCA